MVSGQRNETEMQQPFDSVQEFLQSDKITGQAEPAQLAGFRGELSKGVVENGQPRELTGDDLHRGIKPDTLIIVLLNNPDRYWNIAKCKVPPERTGNFAAFMDEAEDSASLSGYLYVCAEKVTNEFLPEKLKARGYTKVPRNGGNSNPDYLKDLSQ